MCFRVPLGLKPNTRKVPRVSLPFCPRLPAAMSPPFVASQPHCLGHLQHYPWLPHGSPLLPLTLSYRSGTALASSGETLARRRKQQLVALAATCIVMGYLVLYSFALPPTPEPTENNQARIQHKGFLRDTFQVDPYVQIRQGPSDRKSIFTCFVDAFGGCRMVV